MTQVNHKSYITSLKVLQFMDHLKYDQKGFKMDMERTKTGLNMDLEMDLTYLL